MVAVRRGGCAGGWTSLAPAWLRTPGCALDGVPPSYSWTALFAVDSWNEMEAMPVGLSSCSRAPSNTPPCSPLGFVSSQNGDIKEVMEKADKMAAEIAGKA